MGFLFGVMETRWRGQLSNILNMLKITELYALKEQIFSDVNR